MKITVLLLLEIAPVSLRNACDMSRACKPDVAVAHFPLDFRPRNQSRHRVDDDHVNGIGPNQHLADFQRLLPRIRLGNQQIVQLHAQPLGPRGIQGMFGVDERRHAAVSARWR